MNFLAIPYIRAMRPQSLALCSAVALGLSACGGGGGDGEPSPTPAAFSPAIFGSYSTGCGRNPDGGDYKLITATLADAGNGKAKVDVRSQAFGQSGDCNAAELRTEIEASLLATPLAGSKAIRGDRNHPLSADASLAEVQVNAIKYSGISVPGKDGPAKLPLPGVSGKVGYLADGQSLRFLAGRREADGLGGHFSNRVLKKLP